MLKFTNQNENLLAEETSLLSVAKSGPAIKKRRLLVPLLLKSAIFLITVIIIFIFGASLANLSRRFLYFYLRFF